MIIIEGRKEDVSKRLKQRFEYDSSFIDRMLSVDPTGYKYVDYIGKQLEKLIPQLAGQKGGLNVTQQDAIKDVLSMVIPWFHGNVNRITEDDIWKAETIFRERNGMVPNIEGIVKSFKDIAQYENPEFIRVLMDIVDSKKTEREKERELKSQAEKLYEDDDVLVIRPKSHAASCYYGANTKWCTTNEDNPEYYLKYSRRGILIYCMNKITGDKVAAFKSLDTSYDKETSFWNMVDNRIDSIDSNLPNEVMDVIRYEFNNTTKSNWDILPDDEKNRQVLWLENEYMSKKLSHENELVEQSRDYELADPMIGEVAVPAPRQARIVPIGLASFDDIPTQAG